PETLEPGESLVCTEVYTVTQDDVDAGEVINAAATTGEDEDSGEDVGDDDEIVVPYEPEDPVLPPEDALSLAMSAEPDSFSEVGDEITYTLTATNTTDNHTILDVEIPAVPTRRSADLPETLEPGETLVCTEVYTVTQDD